MRFSEDLPSAQVKKILPSYILTLDYYQKVSLTQSRYIRFINWQKLEQMERSKMLFKQYNENSDCISLNANYRGYLNYRVLDYVITLYDTICEVLRNLNTNHNSKVDHQYVCTVYSVHMGHFGAFHDKSTRHSLPSIYNRYKTLKLSINLFLLSSYPLNLKSFEDKIKLLIKCKILLRAEYKILRIKFTQ